MPFQGSKGFPWATRRNGSPRQDCKSAVHTKDKTMMHSVHQVIAMLKRNNNEYCSPLRWFNKCFTLKGPRGYKGSAGKPGRPGFIGPPGPTVSPPDEFFCTPPNIFLQTSNYVNIFLQGHVGVPGKPGPKVIHPPTRIHHKSIFKCSTSSLKSTTNVPKRQKKTKTKQKCACKCAILRHWKD